MGKRFLAGTRTGWWQLVAGLALVALGLALSVQTFVQAAEGESSVRREVSDLAMFGKPLSSTRIRPQTAIDVTRVGKGPIVPVRIRIPALDIDTNVESVGLRNGAMDVPGNLWNIGWLNTNGRPGETGTAVMAGHKDSVQGGAIFWDLNKLKPGDRVYVSDEFGYELSFEVTELGSYNADQAPTSRIFGKTNEARLNLITCDGDFVPEQRTYAKRLVVYTRLLSGK